MFLRHAQAQRHIRSVGHIKIRIRSKVIAAKGKPTLTYHINSSCYAHQQCDNNHGNVWLTSG